MLAYEVIEGEAFDFPLDACGDFALLACDPPYSPHVHENAVSVSTMAARGANGLGVKERDLGFDALTPELRAHLARAAAHVTGWSVVFTDFEGLHGWIDAYEAAATEYVRTLPWIRWSQPQLSGDRPTSLAEALVLGYAYSVGPRGGRKPRKKMWNGPGGLGSVPQCIFDESVTHARDKHETEKPLDLMLSVVSWFSQPRDNVLDLVCGSGTTGVAAALLGRGFCGVERQSVWAERARQRVTSAAQSGKMGLSARDLARAREWAEKWGQEASSVPTPRAPDGSDVKTWERAQRRLSDAFRVAEVCA